MRILINLLLNFNFHFLISFYLDTFVEFLDGGADSKHSLCELEQVVKGNFALGIFLVFHLEVEIFIFELLFDITNHFKQISIFLFPLKLFETRNTLVMKVFEVRK